MTSAADVSKAAEDKLERQADELREKFASLASAKAGKDGRPNYKAVFQIFDTDDSGAINRFEFRQGLTRLKLEYTRDEVDALLRKYFDEDGNNMIEFDEFYKFCKEEAVTIDKVMFEDEDMWEPIDYVLCGIFYPTHEEAWTGK